MAGRVEPGLFHSVVLTSNGNSYVRADNEAHELTVPPIETCRRYASVSAGDFHIVWLRDDGRVVAAGDNRYGQCSIPYLEEGVEYTQVSAGGLHTVLLRSDGHALCVGNNRCGQCNIPALPVGLRYEPLAAEDISAGAVHTVLLRSDSQVLAFGSDDWGQCRVPELQAGEVYVPSRCHLADPPMVMQLVPSDSECQHWQCLSLAGRAVLSFTLSEVCFEEFWSHLTEQLRLPKQKLQVVLPNGELLCHGRHAWNNLMTQRTFLKALKGYLASSAMFAADFHRATVGGRGAGEGVCPRAPAKTWGDRDEDADLLGGFKKNAPVESILPWGVTALLWRMFCGRYGQGAEFANGGEVTRSFAVVSDSLSLMQQVVPLLLRTRGDSIAGRHLLSYQILSIARARVQRTSKWVKLRWSRKKDPFDLVMVLVCREAGLELQGSSFRQGVHLALRLLHLARSFGLRFPQGLEDNMPTVLRTKRCWVIAVCAAVLGVAVGQEVHCSHQNSIRFGKVEKWRSFAQSIRGVVEDALLASLRALPFGANVKREELPLFVETLLEFYPQLLTLAPGEGSDMESEDGRSSRSAVPHSQQTSAHLLGDPLAALLDEMAINSWAAAVFSTWSFDVRELRVAQAKHN
eukprot:s4160_g1.t1